MSDLEFNQYNFAWIRVEGADAHKFLQGQLTCDLNNLAIGEIILGAQCNPKGRVIHNFLLGRLGESCYALNLPASLISTAIAALKKYAVFFKVSIEEDSSLRAVFDETTLSLNGLIARAQIAPNLHVGWVDSKSESQSKLSTKESSKRFFELGIVFIDLESSEKFTPEEIGLVRAGAVSFKKGCYTGQEIVARMHYKGAHKKSIALFKMDGIVESTGDLNLRQNEKSIGTGVSFLHSSNSTFVLASISNDLADASDLTLWGKTLTPVTLLPINQSKQ